MGSHSRPPRLLRSRRAEKATSNGDRGKNKAARCKTGENKAGASPSLFVFPFGLPKRGHLTNIAECGIFGVTGRKGTRSKTSEKPMKTSENQQGRDKQRGNAPCLSRLHEWSQKRRLTNSARCGLLVGDEQRTVQTSETTTTTTAGDEMRLSSSLPSGLGARRDEQTGNEKAKEKTMSTKTKKTSKKVDTKAEATVKASESQPKEKKTTALQIAKADALRKQHEAAVAEHERACDRESELDDTDERREQEEAKAEYVRVADRLQKANAAAESKKAEATEMRRILAEAERAEKKAQERLAKAKAAQEANDTAFARAKVQTAEQRLHWCSCNIVTAQERLAVVSDDKEREEQNEAKAAWFAAMERVRAANSAAKAKAAIAKEARKWVAETDRVAEKLFRRLQKAEAAVRKSAV